MQTARPNERRKDTRMTPAPLRTTHAFSGTYTQEQTKTHRWHTFTVPAGATSIDLRLSFSPERVGPFSNKLTITLFDPNGFRGEGHRGGALHEAHVACDGATPGYLPGRLPAGEWTVRINAQAALQSEPLLTYTLQVAVSSAAAGDRPVLWAPPPERVLARQAGWFRGELHSHTNHSDGHWTLHEMWQRGRELGLDFICLTDHNTITAIAEIAALPHERPLVIPGLEITSFRGHALALGVTRWVDWYTNRGERGGADWMREVHDAGGVFAIAHPFTVGDPACTGCSWELGLPAPGPGSGVDAMEICNEWWSAPSNDNAMMLALWRRLLTPEGGPTAIAGTDAHGSHAWFPGAPQTWIHADELSAPGILGGLRRGHAIVTFGPRFAFSALTDGGDTLIPGSHASANALTLRAAWRDAPHGAELRFLRRNEIIQSTAVSAAGEASIDATVDAAAWFSAELWALDHTPLAISNPIFVTPRAA